jgi:hypothetical protein
MGEVISHGVGGSEGSAELVTFDSLAAFSEAVEEATGVAFDLSSVTGLSADFMVLKRRTICFSWRKTRTMFFPGSLLRSKELMALKIFCPSPLARVPFLFS